MQLPGETAFINIKQRLEKVLAAVEPTPKVVFLSNPPPVDSSGAEESKTADNPQMKKALSNRGRAVRAARNGYLVEKVGENISLFWIDQYLHETIIEPTDPEFLSQLADNETPEVDDHVDHEGEPSMEADPAHTVTTLDEENTKKLLGTHYAEQQYLTIKKYQLDKKNKGHKVPEAFKVERDKLVSDIDARILARANTLFETIKSKILQDITDSHQNVEQPIPDVLYSKIKALLNTIDTTLSRGADFQNQIVELTTVLEATNRLLMNPNQTEIRAYQNLAKTVQGSTNEEMQEVGASMFAIGSFMLLYGALLILLALSPPPVLIGMLFAGVIFAGVGATIAPIGLGFFANSQPTGIARNMDDIAEECAMLSACTH